MRRVFNETTAVSVGSEVSRAILPTNDAGSTRLMENNTSLASFGGLQEERGLVVVNEDSRLSMLCLSRSGRQASANKIVVLLVLVVVASAVGG
jgi:hypothetical protein